MKDSCSGEKCLRELDLNINLHLTLNYVTASEHLKYSAWKRYCVFYNVFVAFVGLNNTTIVAMQNIEFGSFSSDRYPDPAENASIKVIPILNIAWKLHFPWHELSLGLVSVQKSKPAGLESLPSVCWSSGFLSRWSVMEMSDL